MKLDRKWPVIKHRLTVSEYRDKGQFDEPIALCTSYRLIYK